MPEIGYRLGCLLAFDVCNPDLKRDKSLYVFVCMCVCGSERDIDRA